MGTNRDKKTRLGRLYYTTQTQPLTGRSMDAPTAQNAQNVGNANADIRQRRAVAASAEQGAGRKAQGK